MSINLKNPIHLLATGFGSGLLKPAPGTWGSLAGWLIALAIAHSVAQPQGIFLGLTLMGFVLGCFICQKTSEDLGVHDDGRIVWDEMVAIWLIFACLPEYSGLYSLLALGLFRLFDITKPPPIGAIDRRLKGGLGIMVDDILAAIYSLIILYLLHGIG